MKYTIQGYCNLRRIDYEQLIDDIGPNVDPEKLAQEVYEKKDIEALLLQPGAVAIRPVKVSLSDKTRTLFVGARKNGGEPNLGAEYDNMLELHHFIALPRKEKANN